MPRVKNHSEAINKVIQILQQIHDLSEYISGVGVCVGLNIIGIHIHFKIIKSEKSMQHQQCKVRLEETQRLNLDGLHMGHFTGSRRTKAI